MAYEHEADEWRSEVAAMTEPERAQALSDALADGTLTAAGYGMAREAGLIDD